MAVLISPLNGVRVIIEGAFIERSFIGIGPRHMLDSVMQGVERVLLQVEFH